MGGGDSESHREIDRKRKRVQKRSVSGVQKGMDAPQGSKFVLSDHCILSGKLLPIYGGGKTIVSFERRFAKIALKFYEKRLDAKFKVLEVLFSNRAMLAVPGFGLHRLWCHVSFIAKSRNAGDASQKHFFGEMVYNLATEKYDVTFCSIFEPSDPGNINGCVFCPHCPSLFVHPAHGCPADGREIDKFTVQKQIDASQGQISGCSKVHPRRPTLIQADDNDRQRYLEKFKSLSREYAEIALEFYEKKHEGVKYEIIEVVFDAHKPLLVPRTKRIEGWCHVCFTARRKNVDCSVVSPKHFFGELLRDVSTRNYNATYCEIFKPIDCRTSHRIRPPLQPHPFSGCRVGILYSMEEIDHGCVICPDFQVHPLNKFCVGRHPYTTVEHPQFFLLN